MKGKIAFVDPASFSLPYDVFRILELSKEFEIDFYCSSSRYNQEYLKVLSVEKNINIKMYNVASPIARHLGLYNYFCMLLKVFYRRKKYKNIHFQWALFLPLEIIFFTLLRKKMIFTFHNDVSHNSKRKFSLKNYIIACICNEISFVSKFTMSKFIANHSSSFINKSTLNQHPLIPLVDDSGVCLSVKKAVPNSNLINGRLIFWGNVKDYKGIESFLHITDDNIKRYRPLILGKWDKSLLGLKSAIIDKGIEVVDEFIDMSYLINYFTRENVFILPYRKATQSGVLYTLLYYDCEVISSNTGDNAVVLNSLARHENIFEFSDPENMNRVINKTFLNIK